MLRNLIFVVLIIFFKGTVLACDNPMSADQVQAVGDKLFQIMAYEENTETGQYHHKGEFGIDECRNISVSYGGKTIIGKLHQLFTELNFAHHNSAYFGLVQEEESGVDANLVFHQEDDSEKMIDWLFDINKQAVELLYLAGYKIDPSKPKREKLLGYSIDTMERPDYWDRLNSFLGSGINNTASNESNVACDAEKNSCLAQCKGLPYLDPGKTALQQGFSGPGPQMRCESQCRKISCY